MDPDDPVMLLHATVNPIFDYGTRDTSSAKVSGGDDEAQDRLEIFRSH